MTDWPFDEPENVAVFTVRQVLDEGQAILQVTHDNEDGAWQFLPGGSVELADALVVGLRTMFRVDPSIGELADLPLGWIAVRGTPSGPWQRQPQNT